MASRSKLNPTTQTIAWDRTTDLPSSVQSINVTIIEDYDISYVQYYINFESTGVQWLYAPGISGSYIENANGFAELPLELQNLDDLPAGNYKANIIIELSDVDAYRKTLTAVVNLTLTGNAQDAIKTDKDNYNLTYVRSSDALTGDVNIVILNNTENADIEFSTIGSLFKEGIGKNSFVLEQDPAAPFATNNELPTSGIKVVNCRLKKDGIYIYNFTVTVAVLESDGIIADPAAFDFKLRKGYNESQMELLHIINPLNKNFTITGPAWLNFNAQAGNSTVYISVETVNSETVAVGNYTGNIEISYEGKLLLVPVTLQVIEFINIPNRSFCLDDIILTANRQDDSAKILQISMLAKFHTAEKQYEITSIYKVMYQNGVVTTDIGQKVHRMFPRNRNSLFSAPKSKPFENIFVYKPAEIVLTISEMDINYAVKKTVVLPPIFLYPGKKPKMFPLFTNHNIRRRISGTSHVFSYLADQVMPEDIIGNPIESNPVMGSEVCSVKIDDADGLIAWENQTSILGVDYYKLRQNEVVEVEWQNQNFAPELFSFTKDFIKTKDKTHIYQENSFTLNNEKFEVRNAVSAKIRTGFILKAEAALVDELIDSKLCFLKINGKTYQSFAISSKLVDEDSELQLYEYEVEFLINGEI